MKSIEDFRRLMLDSTRNYFTNRGYSGLQLRDYCKGLAEEAAQHRILGATDGELKQRLAVLQSPTLRFLPKFASIHNEFSMDPTNDGSFVRLQPNGLPVDTTGMTLNSRSLVTQSYEENGSHLVIQGRLISEGHYAGLGTRLESTKSKFCLLPEDLVGSLGVFDKKIKDREYKTDDTAIYTAMAEQIKAHGGLERLHDRYIDMHKIPLGIRIFVQKAWEIYSTAKQLYGMTDEEAREVMAMQRFKIVINQASGDNVLGCFSDADFVGFNPKHFLFMKQATHPTYKISESGDILPDESYQSQGNHGLLVFQSVLDKQWFRVLANQAGGYDQESPLPSADYHDFMSSASIGLVESIEDTTQLTRAFDFVFIALIDHYGRMENGRQMFMQMVAQKQNNPQKGGFLASMMLGQATRNLVIESSAAPEISPEEIKILNRNRNGFYSPSQVDQDILLGPMINNLHPTFYIAGWKDGAPIMRVDSKVPQGERNLFLRSLYVQFEPVQQIENLKDPADIIPTLSRMSQFDSNSDLVNFARNFLGLKF
jgi:hypothetical protein